LDEPITLGPGEGELVRTTVIKSDRPDLDLFELAVAPGAGADLHFHKLQSDAFYVLEGELEFRVGEETVRGTAGTFVLAPPGVHHAFRNTGTATARVLNLHAPGGFARYLREIDAHRRAGTEPDDAFFAQHDVYDVE
jgi:quercetin dioxygenase-like cupin family protein